MCITKTQPTSAMQYSRKYCWPGNDKDDDDEEEPRLLLGRGTWFDFVILSSPSSLSKLDDTDRSNRWFEQDTEDTERVLDVTVLRRQRAWAWFTSTPAAFEAAPSMSSQLSIVMNEQSLLSPTSSTVLKMEEKE
mmetsp:Transcript_46476/g.113194  ORF Transcript_46476/g.113194 Transcript_46476/m.113194 type:complete len:134 (+) Transcript_46476:3087-3488(+)